MVLPTNIRSVLTSLITFKLSDRDYRILKEDCLGIISTKFLNDNLKDIHDFLYININNNYICKNFLEILDI